MVDGTTSGANNPANPLKGTAGTSTGSVDQNVRITTNGGEGVRRILVAPEIDREHLENLQRWVATGHDEWCRDARLVAAEEIRRLAEDFAEGGLALNVVEQGTSNAEDDRNVATFEWVPSDGRAVYRVTVERLAWLKQIAGDAERIVWVPTRVEICLQDEGRIPEMRAGAVATVVKDLVG